MMFGLVMGGTLTIVPDGLDEPTTDVFGGVTVAVTGCCCNIAVDG